MRLSISAAVMALCVLAGCNAPAEPGGGGRNQAVAAPSRGEAPALPPVEPPAPGTPGGLPDDRTPISEVPFAATSAQGAADVVQTYYALIEAGKYGEARALWRGGGEGSGKSEAEFAAGFSNYAEYHAQIGAPGRIEGAAGSSFVEVPVRLYGRLRDGSPFRQPVTVTLRRVNDVPGSTAEQRRWHISDIRSETAPER